MNKTAIGGFQAMEWRARALIEDVLSRGGGLAL